MSNKIKAAKIVAEKDRKTTYGKTMQKKVRLEGDDVNHGKSTTKIVTRSGSPRLGYTRKSKTKYEDGTKTVERDVYSGRGIDDNLGERKSRKTRVKVPGERAIKTKKK